MHLNALHHVELCVGNGKNIVSYFTDKLGYSLRALRDTAVSRQWVVGSQKSTFVVTERKEHPHPASSGAPFTHFCCPDRHRVDSVFNVALEVKDVDMVTARMQGGGAKLFQPVTVVGDDRGVVRYSIVSSCCGNIVHTLLDKSEYRGSFLPTFAPVAQHPAKPEPITHIDHLTYVCHPGQSGDIIQWYSDCLGMKKFKTNPTEDVAEGLVIRDGVGMRLRVMDYFPCAESGIFHPNPDGSSLDESSLKIVIAESLPERENSHIGAFLAGHGGPGLQHIGLHSPDIVSCVDTLFKKNVKFRNPPAAYYRYDRKKEEIEAAGYDVRDFQRLGILIDSEADASDESHNERFLLQIFTLPLFTEETFFLEVVQRQGARGFGAGNVTALARSIEEERRKSSASQSLHE